MNYSTLSIIVVFSAVIFWVAFPLEAKLNNARLAAKTDGKNSHRSARHSRSLLQSYCYGLRPNMSRDPSDPFGPARKELTYQLSATTLYPHTMEGKPFNENLIWILRKYGMTYDAALDYHYSSKRDRSPNIKNAVFVVAANDEFFPYLRTVIFNLKTMFGRNHKIIGYDLGGISSKKEWMAELNSVCALEWRVFNWSMLPENVHHLKIFTWKIAIVAEVLYEHPILIYMDTSVTIQNNTGFDPYFEKLGTGSISPIQMPYMTGHGTRFATHPDMYKYIPTYLNYLEKDIEMLAATFFIIHRTKDSIQLLKWALLCGMTRKCIEPAGAKLYCPKPYVGVHMCHRQDQSVLSILLNNLELGRAKSCYDRMRRYSYISSYSPDHPNSQEPFYKVLRRQKLDKTPEEFIQTVNCQNPSD